MSRNEINKFTLHFDDGLLTFNSQLIQIYFWMYAKMQFVLSHFSETTGGALVKVHTSARAEQAYRQLQWENVSCGWTRDPHTLCSLGF